MKRLTNSHSATVFAGLVYAHTVMVCENARHRLGAFQKIALVGVFAHGRIFVLDANALGI